jgi:hypothetical protein
LLGASLPTGGFIPRVPKISPPEIGIPLPPRRARSLATLAVDSRRPQPMRWRIDHAPFANSLAASLPAHPGSCSVPRSLRKNVGEAPVVRNRAEVSEGGWQGHLCFNRPQRVGGPRYEEVDLRSWIWDRFAGQADPRGRVHSAPSSSSQQTRRGIGCIEQRGCELCGTRRDFR